MLVDTLVPVTAGEDCMCVDAACGDIREDKPRSLSRTRHARHQSVGGEASVSGLDIPTYSLTSSAADDADSEAEWQTCMSVPGACGVVRRIDCRKVNSPFGKAMSRLCGYQPVMLKRRQHVFVMRHGERIDSSNPDWIKTALRPWDPPLSEWGVCQSYQVGAQLRKAGWGITRVVCSPSLRCVQSAAEVVRALMADVTDDYVLHDRCFHPAALRAQIAPSRTLNVQRHIMQCITNPDPPSVRWRFKRKQAGGHPAEHVQRVKVSIDHGLFEIMNSPKAPPTNLCLPSHALEALFPSGTYTPLADQSFPRWPEDTSKGVLRLVAAIDRLAELTQEENILVVTHAEAVHASVLRCQKKANMYNIMFGAYSHMERNVYRDIEDETDRGVGPWQLTTKSGTSGVYFQS